MARSIFSRRFGVNRAGEAEFGVIRDFESVIEILRLDHRQQRTENLFLLELRFGGNIGNDRGLQKVSFSRILRAPPPVMRRPSFFPISM